MAILTKKMYIKGSTGDQSACNIYTTSIEAGDVYHQVLVDNMTCYIALGPTTNAKATPGRVIKQGETYAVLSELLSVPYTKEEFTTPGTYTWTCPEGVYYVKATIAGGGGSYYTFSKTSTVKDGGGGELRLATMQPVTPGETYSLTVGAGGAYTAPPDDNSASTSNYGEQSTAFTIVSRGGVVNADNDPDYVGTGGIGGTSSDPVGKDGWIYLEYGAGIPSDGFTQIENSIYNVVGTYTWVVPAGVTRLRLTTAGGGGGDGGNGTSGDGYWEGNGYTGYGGEGGTGGLQSIVTTVPELSILTLTVGQGGENGESGGSVNVSSGSGTSGTAGGTSTIVFSEEILSQATGGSGGKGGSSTTSGATNGSDGANGLPSGNGASPGNSGWVYIELGGGI